MSNFGVRQSTVAMWNTTTNQKKSPLKTVSGRDFHVNLVKEVNTILKSNAELWEFHEDMDQCDAIDDMIFEHLDSNTFQKTYQKQ